MPDSSNRSASTWRPIADDPTLRTALVRRAEILRRTREWFWSRGLIEIDPPILAPWAGMEPHLAPLSTTARDTAGAPLRLYHHTSPEYALKKLLAAGMPDCFALGHAFRDGEVSALHQVEFTLLEWYRRDASYTALMDDTAELVASLARDMNGSTRIDVAGREVDLAPPWERVTVAGAMRRWGEVDIERHPDAASFREHARAHGHAWVRDDESWDDVFWKIFLTCVEPALGFPRPVFLDEYPARFGALARRSTAKPEVVERFEAYVGGVELCNAFGELTDPVEQRARFLAEREERIALGREPLPVDEDLLDALAHLPPCAGNALGVDRLVMLLLGERDIARVVPFPWERMAAWSRRHGV